MKTKALAILLMLCLLAGWKIDIMAAGGDTTDENASNAFALEELDEEPSSKERAYHTLLNADTEETASRTGLAQDADGIFYLYVNGEKADSFSGLYNDSLYGWWYIDQGQVAFTYNEVIGNAKDGAWKITNGALDFTYTGWFVSETEGICYFEDGKLLISSGEGIALPRTAKENWTSVDYYNFAKQQPAFTNLSAYLTVLAYMEAEKSLQNTDRKFLKDKTIVCLGDSITWGLDINYPLVLQQKFPGARVFNYGICGGTISTVGRNAMVRNYPSLPPQADVIILFAGVNDWYQGAPLGSLETLRAGSFSGDMNLVLANLKAAYPGAQVIVCTPLDNHESLGTGTPNQLPLERYANAMISLAERHELPVIDLYHSGYLNSCDAGIRENWMMDDIHPSEAGYTFLGTYLASQLLQILQ